MAYFSSLALLTLLTNLLSYDILAARSVVGCNVWLVPSYIEDRPTGDTPRSKIAVKTTVENTRSMSAKEAGFVRAKPEGNTKMNGNGSNGSGLNVEEIKSAPQGMVQFGDGEAAAKNNQTDLGASTSGALAVLKADAYMALDENGQIPEGLNGPQIDALLELHVRADLQFELVCLSADLDGERLDAAAKMGTDELIAAVANAKELSQLSAAS